MMEEIFKLYCEIYCIRFKYGFTKTYPIKSKNGMQISTYKL